MKKFLSLFFCSLVVANMAFAGDMAEVKMLNEAKITLQEAISIAEKHIGGKALSGSIEDDSFSPEFEVTVAKDNKVFDVKVNGVTKEVMGSREDVD